MESAEAIKKIENANFWKDVFTSVTTYKSEYKTYALLLHPDRCKDPGAEEAFKKLTEYRDSIEGGFTFNDDIGTVTYTDYSVTIEAKKGNEAYLQKSFDNFNKLTSLKDKASLHFRKYLPATAEYKDGKLTFTNDQRIFSLNNHQMPLDHARWVLSRLLEFSAWLNEVGYVHAGINPTSIFIMPDSHGIICISFYHMTKVGSNLTSVSAKHAGWYPSYVLDKSLGKKPTADGCIDVELSKRTMIYLLGDKSGNGIVLKKKYENELINFLTSLKRENYKAYEEYIALIHKLYGKPKWHEYVV